MRRDRPPLASSPVRPSVHVNVWQVRGAARAARVELLGLLRAAAARRHPDRAPHRAERRHQLRRARAGVAAARHGQSGTLGGATAGHQKPPAARQAASAGLGLGLPLALVPATSDPTERPWPLSQRPPISGQLAPFAALDHAGSGRPTCSGRWRRRATGTRRRSVRSSTPPESCRASLAPSIEGASVRLMIRGAVYGGITELFTI